jgi:signal transduction histidine kinase
MPMTGARQPTKPTFHWQAILIVSPLALLATLALVSLRQDRLLAQQEALNRAEGFAADIANRFYNVLTGLPASEVPSRANWLPTPSRLAFQVDRHGGLVFPPLPASLNEPEPLDLRELHAEAASAWQAATVADLGANTDPVAAWNAVLQSSLPGRFPAIATYALARSLIAQSNINEARELLETVLASSPDLRTESGLPVAALAQWQLLRLNLADPAAAHGDWLQAACSNFVFAPSFLTPFLLEQTSLLLRAADADARNPSNPVDRWLALWTEHERTRALYLATREAWAGNDAREPASEAQPRPLLLWVNVPEIKHDESSRWLLLGVAGDDAGGQWYLARPETEVQRTFVEIVSSVRLPAHFGVGAELAGASFGMTPTSPLAVKTADGSLRPGKPPWVTASVLLTNPDAYYANYRSRTQRLISLVAAAAVVAVIGLALAYRAFRRQLLLNEMKSNFVSSVSHELRAPIASVRLLAESLERGKISEPQKQNEYFRFIGQECRRLSSLIENVLDFSRIEQGRKQYEFEPTNLTALVEQTVKLMEPYAAERGVRLELNAVRQGNDCQGNADSGSQNSSFNSPGNPVELNIDSHAIQQALVNLMDNAIKHSPKGETVTVGLEGRQRRPGVAPASTPSETDGGNMETGVTPVLLSVSDHGPGIPASEHERIFERFHRLGSELRRETQGVGIGLSIVKHVVEAHGGQVRVESEAGKGSRFTIELPMKN